MLYVMFHLQSIDGAIGFIQIHVISQKLTEIKIELNYNLIFFDNVIVCSKNILVKILIYKKT